MADPLHFKCRKKIRLDSVEYFAFQAPDGFVVAAMLRGVACVYLEGLYTPQPSWSLILKWVAHLKGQMRWRLGNLMQF